MHHEAARFVIDESSWQLQSASVAQVEAALEALLERLETAANRGEVAVYYDGFYEFDVTPKPMTLLFENSRLLPDRDLRTRVMLAIDRLEVWRDEPALDVTIANATVLAPSIAYAHHQVCQGRAVACLPLITAGRHGPVAVAVDARSEQVHFVVDEPSHQGFFRAAIEVENCDEKLFPTMAKSAFPYLNWAEDLWRGLRAFSKPFHDLRAQLSHHLAVLNDHGRDIFRDLQPMQRTPALGSHGVLASGENGATMGNAKARRARTRSWDGEEYVFWWHTKLQRNVDRIHFLYHGDTNTIVVGLFSDHCYLPG